MKEFLVCLLVVVVGLFVYVYNIARASVMREVSRARENLANEFEKLKALFENSQYQIFEPGQQPGEIDKSRIPSSGLMFIVKNFGDNNMIGFQEWLLAKLEERDDINLSTESETRIDYEIAFVEGRFEDRWDCSIVLTDLTILPTEDRYFLVQLNPSS